MPAGEDTCAEPPTTRTSRVSARFCTLTMLPGAVAIVASPVTIASA